MMKTPDATRTRARSARTGLLGAMAARCAAAPSSLSSSLNWLLVVVVYVVSGARCTRRTTHTFRLPHLLSTHGSPQTTASMQNQAQALPAKEAAEAILLGLGMMVANAKAPHAAAALPLPPHPLPVPQPHHPNPAPARKEEAGKRDRFDILLEACNVSKEPKRRKRVAARVNAKWTPEDDAALQAAVDELGAKDWKNIAKKLDGTRTDIQCLNRWNKVTKPGLVKVRARGKRRWGGGAVEERRTLGWERAGEEREGGGGVGVGSGAKARIAVKATGAASEGA